MVTPSPATVDIILSDVGVGSGVGIDTTYPRHGYAVSSLMDTAYWLSEYREYDLAHLKLVLSFVFIWSEVDIDTAYPRYWIRRIGVSWSRDHARIRRIFLDGYGILVVRIVILKISSFKLQNARLLLIFTKYSVITAILKYKRLNGSLSRYKARLVANGSTQLEGVNVDETLSHVVKPETIQTVLSLAASRHLPIHQLDVKNAFVHCDLSKTVYIHQPLVFVILSILIMCVYYNVLSMGSSRSLECGFRGMFLSQRKYVVEILERAQMAACNPSRTPVDTESKLGTDVQQVRLYMHDPREPHFSALKNLAVIVSSLATTYSRGPLSASRRFLVLVQRPNIMVLPMPLLRLVG
uniref:Ribonuclease H-like domain-containing protein n=1 Tax=Tanacetum cinerariifolium TaxID=118510 RepID=A0A6L2KDN6_TANCI|nr:ribonuclease H-like domain-containing protein [Tanacetum cinerariifolium]